ncbi:hypothetical protein PLIIFM63780_004092 [Purpureocillium lilacinum]|uniref:uncharacterized protein n=1 Tax=Purpureocillium lilacinum TaxID=33203 RepID=UPI002082E6CD|nr:hypothetical protein PLICBS_000643 [Purpureocillium lilacinum]GJN80565.1 hypothetical protein PLIIFM63780_004092 [Purpureocillium lilacinum]
MYFAAPLLTLLALGTGSFAATVLRRDPATHVGTFQTYAHQGCSFMPLCTRVVYGADVVRPPCHSFGDDSVESVKLTEIGDGCQFFVYTDSACSAGRSQVKPNTCTDAQGEWKSWGMECLPGHY